MLKFSAQVLEITPFLAILSLKTYLPTSSRKRKLQLACNASFRNIYMFMYKYKYIYIFIYIYIYIYILESIQRKPVRFEASRNALCLSVLCLSLVSLSLGALVFDASRAVHI